MIVALALGLFLMDFSAAEALWWLEHCFRGMVARGVKKGRMMWFDDKTYGLGLSWLGVRDASKRIKDGHLDRSLCTVLCIKHRKRHGDGESQGNGNTKIQKRDLKKERKYSRLSAIWSRA